MRLGEYKPKQICFFLPKKQICRGNSPANIFKKGETEMSNGFSRRGADGLVRHYNSRGVMTGFSQKGGDGITRHYDNNRNMTGFSQSNGYDGYNHYDSRGRKK